MNCYYCGNVISDEEKVCSRCGREVKEIRINLDCLIVNQTSTDDDSNNEVFEKVLDDIIEKVKQIKMKNVLKKKYSLKKLL